MSCQTEADEAQREVEERAAMGAEETTQWCVGGRLRMDALRKDMQNRLTELQAELEGLKERAEGAERSRLQSEIRWADEKQMFKEVERAEREHRAMDAEDRHAAYEELLFGFKEVADHKDVFDFARGAPRQVVERKTKMKYHKAMWATEELLNKAAKGLQGRFGGPATELLGTLGYCSDRESEPEGTSDGRLGLEANRGEDRRERPSYSSGVLHQQQSKGRAERPRKSRDGGGRG